MSGRDTHTRRSPWETKAYRWWQRALAAMAILPSAICLLGSAGLMLAGLFIAPEEMTSSNLKSAAIGVLCFVGGVALTVVLYMALIRMLDIGLSGGGEKAKDGPDFHFGAVSLLRSMSGDGEAVFGENEIDLYGAIGPSYLPLIIAFLAINGISLVVMLLGGRGYFVYGGLPLLILYYYAFRKKGVITVEAANVKKIRCTGPTVAITFRKPPVPQLRGVALCVCRRRREEFFRNLNGSLPGLLPREYIDAIELPVAEKSGGQVTGTAIL